MNHYILRYEVSKEDCNCREKDIMESINSYPSSTKLLENTYYIHTFDDINTVLKNVSNGLNDDDKLVIAQVRNYTGKRTPNV